MYVGAGVHVCDLWLIKRRYEVEAVAGRGRRGRRSGRSVRREDGEERGATSPPTSTSTLEYSNAVCEARQ